MKIHQNKIKLKEKKTKQQQQKFCPQCQPTEQKNPSKTPYKPKKQAPASPTKTKLS